MPIAVPRPLQTGLISLHAAWMLSAGSIAPALSQSPVAPTTTPAASASPTVSPAVSPTGSPSAASPPASPAATEPAPTTLPEQLAQIWQKHQLPLLLLGVALVGYGGVLWLKPLWLLNLPTQDLAIPGTSWKIPLGLLKIFKYRDRVLDTWVNQHWQFAESEFLQLPNVAARQIHIALPVEQDGSLINELTAEQLAKRFAKKSSLVLIVGEGGAGKTSLACQIAQWGLKQQLCPNHRLLPILIDTELSESLTLMEAIRRQLEVLTDQAEPIDPELLQQLLQRRRVLVIVDHLSEMGEVTRKQVMPESPNFPVKALIVTSRVEEPLGNLTKTILKPLQIEGNRLSQFMDAYLDCRQKRHLFEDEEYFEACRRLSRMVGQRSITVLLARLYIDQMIEQQAGAGGKLPESVPELMLFYLNQLNAKIEPPNRRDELQVQRDAQMVAWQCLQQTYRPTDVSKEQVLAALATLKPIAEKPEADAADRLKYLEDRLQLVKTLPSGIKVRIVLDPLTEYLAAYQFVDRYREHQPVRQTVGSADPAIDPALDQPNSAATPSSDLPPYFAQLLESIQQTLAQSNDRPELVQGFLLAVRDCCLLRQRELQIPDLVIDELARQAGLDPAELQQAQEKRRLRLVISDLAAPELDYRLRAIADLAKLGATARIAIPNLLAMVENRNQEIVVRAAAINTLAAFGSADSSDTMPDRLLALLQDATEDPTLRRRSAEALGQLGVHRHELIRLLEDSEQPLPVRQGAARAIEQIGTASGTALPMLVVELKQGQWLAQPCSIPVWQQPLSDSLSLDLVEIPAGEFWMGSAADEVGRDQYSHLPEAAGLDVESRHRVRLPQFWMSRFPITQAQWRAVAALPSVERSLDPDPANFKGDQRPVETVSWYGAMEFCARLSQLTGKTYRLPSEAEWEYACRAGTSTPFHFGDSLDATIANYNGKYTYGSGKAGEFRNATTEVGSFGVVNRFGLADMHGNVWEWCLDHWHPSYEGAPIDGSAWMTDGDSRYRLLRGGSWYDIPGGCRSAFRRRTAPGGLATLNGFRVVCASPWTS